MIVPVISLQEEKKGRFSGITNCEQLVDNFSGFAGPVTRERKRGNVPFPSFLGDS